MIAPASTQGKLYRYNASAGSGKTFNLVYEYLRLVLEDPRRIRRILAITFTNDATNELRSRIVKRLFELAHPDLSAHQAGDVAQLRAQLHQALPQLSEAQLTTNAREALSQALHRSDALSVQTIDSFFQRMLRSFGVELSINFHYRVELDVDRPLRQAVDRLLRRVGRAGEENLTAWLTEYVDEILDKRTRAALRRRLTGQGRQILDRIPPTWSNQNVLRGDELRAFLDQRRQAFAQACQSAAARFVALLDDYGLKPEAFKGGSKSPVRFYPLIANASNDFAAFLKANYNYLEKEKLQRLLELDDDESGWVGTSKKNDESKLARAFLAAGGLAAHYAFVRTFEQGYRRYATAEQLREQLYLLGVLSELLAELDRVLDRQHSLLIANVPHRLADVVNDYDVSFIYEKMGTRYGHFLIDEFQDTSVEQWKILRPLVHEGLSYNLDSFVVGDPKQAIYGWRGGRVELFVHQLRNEIDPAQFEAKTLGDNWRSWPRIVQFNNALFCTVAQALDAVLEESLVAKTNSSSGLPDAVAEELRQENYALVDELREIYSAEGVIQQPRKTNAGLGYVRCEFVPNEPKPKPSATETETTETETTKADDENTTDADYRDWRTQALHRTLETIEACLQAGYSVADLALLVRETDSIVRLSQAIRSELKLPVASRALEMVQASPVVRVLVNLLRWINRPADRLALVTAAHDYHRHLLGQAFDWRAAYGLRCPNDSAAFAARLLATFPPPLAEHIASLQYHDMIEQTEELIQLLGLHARCDAAVLFLQEQMLGFIGREGNDAVAFLDWWAEKGCQESIPAGEPKAIRVLTIHQSKGLEFPVVILPFAEWDLEPRSTSKDILWVDTTTDGINPEWRRLGAVLPVKARQSLLATDFAPHWFEYRRRNLIEQVNLLYVALTRAKERLYVFAPQAQYTKAGDLTQNCRGISAVLRHILAKPFELQGTDPMGPYPIAADWHCTPDGTVIEYGQAQAKPRSTESQATPPPRERLHYESNPWRKRLVIRTYAGDWSQLNHHNWAQVRYLNWGSLVHEVLANLRYLDDAPARMAAALDRLSRSGRINATERQRIEAEVQALLALPQFQDWFSPRWTVRTERTILAPSGQIHQPDRVLTDANGRAVVIDFKTGRPDSSHAPQVRRYGQQLQAMGYGPVEGWLVYLGDNPQIEPVAL